METEKNNSKQTNQMQEWGGDFGKEYTLRNNRTISEIQNLYLERFGITRSQMNNDFLGNLPKSIRILEVGSNVGNQLQCLQEMKFLSLYGIELQAGAVEIAKKQTEGINIIQGSAFDIPFKDDFFDLVFTSGVLIHISPNNIKKVITEIYRCSKKYIWGFEYFAESYQEIEYRGKSELLWKTDFPQLYLDTFDDLKLIKEKKYEFKDNNKNVDVMYLLEKG